MRRNLGPMAVLGALVLAVATMVTGLAAAMPAASAQDFDEIVRELERNGYYIESGADASDSEMRALVDRGNNANGPWYFVVLAGPAEVGYAADLRDTVRPTGNVLVHSIESDSEGDFDQVDLVTDSTEAIEERALAAFETNWVRPADYMDDVVDDFAQITAGSSSSGSTGSTSGSSSDSTSSGGGFPWGLLAIPAVLGGGLWFMSRRGKKKQQDEDLETAQKIRAELQTEIDELANDVLVMSGPVDVSDKPQAVEFYREATDTYLDISDEIPDMDELEHADLGELSGIGARVAHARWQMDAAEALIDGEPLPDKPKVEPPPPPPVPPQQRTPQQRQQRRQRMPQRAPRPRVPYSPSRRRSGGGLLDILIAGAGMMGTSRGRSRRGGGGMFGGSSRSRSGGMFGGSGSRAQPRQTQSRPRPGGGVFGGSSRSRTSGRSSSSRSSSRRSSSRRSGSSRSTSKRRRR